MSRVSLILTALPELVSKRGDRVLLGEWCQYNERVASKFAPTSAAMTFSQVFEPSKP